MSKLLFSRKKTAVLPELRPMYKVGKILLILKICCSGGKASLLKLHLFNWAMLESQRLQILLRSAEEKELLLGVWGIDPSLNMALNYAISEDLLCRLQNGNYKLTSKSESFISGSDLINLFDNEFNILKKIDKKITETMVTQAAKRWVDEV
ncbi:MAG: hypothetical protein WC024_19250 [Shewanella sp.]|jgi:hypothetical protein|uniref:hypothetical protein n=1 Tax=unclassified Shewanella TaxID=196818 RepID=UPI0021D95C55|nr:MULTISPECIES: hypothetical protein [unclassified Shewanella]MCU8033032.1 hypothetical protein [Shewanella sp. SM71]MCU8096421.1 hypothetical protein [Shewanella sp. SM102]